MLKAIIVEDEISSRETLRNYLNSYCPDVFVAAEAGDIKAGKEAIESQQPDLVFLDIEMPFGNGFDLLESLEQTDFKVIFVTAFSHYALQAIQYSASNYILKPIDIDELIAAVDKARAQTHQADTTKVLLDNLKNTQKQATKIVLPVLEGFEIVKAAQITRCEAQDNFTKFYLEGGQSLLICRTLKHYEQILGPLGFSRIHKSHMVNIEKLTKYFKGKGGSVTMEDGTELPVSPTKKAALLAKLGLS